jgi:hypothetical protein
MISMSPVTTIVVGFVLVLTGAVIPLLMTLRVIAPGFFLCFLSYTATISGLFLGILGTALQVKLDRKK